MTELTLPNGEPIGLKPDNPRNFRGTRIPGASLFTSTKNAQRIHFHVYQHPSFALSLLQLQPSQPIRFSMKDSPQLRLEVMLSGEVQLAYPDGSNTILYAGQYLLNDQHILQVSFNPSKECRYFRIHYSADLLDQLGIAVDAQCNQSHPLPALMLETIHRILDHPFAEQLYTFYYGNCVRELLFHHASATDFIRPGSFSPQQLAFVYETDQYIAENLDASHTLRDLARRAGTNTFFLKKAYEEVFGIGIFPRLIQRRMEHAQFLLESTDLPLKDICSQSGYATLAGFITEFRKRFGQTPNQWRKRRRGG